MFLQGKKKGVRWLFCVFLLGLCYSHRKPLRQSNAEMGDQEHRH